MERTFTGLTLEELADRLGSRTRALAALRWLHARPSPVHELPPAIDGVTGAAWANVGCALPAWRVAERGVSADGTIKYALDLGGSAVETVLIPTAGRSTVCVSSQAGCSRNCAFCATARLGFGRHLEAGEIVLQYLVARADTPPDAPARNVVFMGMGEPMDNLDEVLRAIDVLTQAPAPRLAANHITVSTSGVLPGMRRFLAASGANLALSLNATTDEQREKIMPQTKQWPIGELLGELRADRARAPRRRHFIEYVLLAGVNDSDDDARRLVSLLGGIAAHVNLIPHNAFRESELGPPSDDRLRAFQAIVHGAGVRCLVRGPRGREIGAACGQLALRVGAEAATSLPTIRRPRRRE
jgi:23S rRNA (adenine2503-C2)-methyltransferase